MRSKPDDQRSETFDHSLPMGHIVPCERLVAATTEAACSELPGLVRLAPTVAWLVYAALLPPEQN